MNAPATIHIERLNVHVSSSPHVGLPGLDALARAILEAPAAATAASTAPTARFELSTDGTVVTDHKTGLQWAAEETAKELTFADAEKHCAELGLGGFDDWRMPDLEELESIRDLSRHNPCVDTAYFKSNAGWVWSRTPTAWSSGCAWVVDFSDGYVGSDDRYSRAFVRAVRRVSPAGQ